MRLDFFFNLLQKNLDFLIFLSKALRSRFSYIFLQKNFLNLYVRGFDLIFVLFFLQNNGFIRMQTLLDIQVIDYPSSSLRFKVIYQLLSLINSFRLALNIFTNEINFLPSITKLFPASM